MMMAIVPALTFNMILRVTMMAGIVRISFVGRGVSVVRGQSGFSTSMASGRAGRVLIVRFLLVLMIRVVLKVMMAIIQLLTLDMILRVATVASFACLVLVVGVDACPKAR